MLGQRVLTALVLLALLLPSLLVASPWPFALLTLALIGAAAWEWSRLNGAPGWPAVAIGVGVAAAGAAALEAGWVGTPPSRGWWAAVPVWLIAVAILLRRGPSGWPPLPQGFRLALGVLLLWTAWFAFAQSKGIGLNYLLSVLCLVWASDIAAYVGGRRFGRRKLAPTISPGKSWEGVWSAFVGVAVLAALWLAVERSFDLGSPSLYSQLLQQWGPAGLALALAVLVGMGIAGDLLESLVKRAAGAKDSSQLLPGHGGVLDRLDALLPVVPIALALTTL